MMSKEAASTIDEVNQTPNESGGEPKDSKKALPTKTQPKTPVAYRCTLCLVSLNSEKAKDLHLASPAHLKKAKEAEGKGEKPGKVLQIDLMQEGGDNGKKPEKVLQVDLVFGKKSEPPRKSTLSNTLPPATEIMEAAMEKYDDVKVVSSYQSQLITLHKTTVKEGKTIGVTGGKWGEFVVRKHHGGSAIVLRDPCLYHGPNTLGNIRWESESDDEDLDSPDSMVSESVASTADTEVGSEKTDDDFKFLKFKEKDFHRFDDLHRLSMTSISAVLGDSVCQSLLNDVLSGVNAGGKPHDRPGGYSTALTFKERSRLAGLIASLAAKVSPRGCDEQRFECADLVFSELRDSLTVNRSPPLRVDLVREVTTAHSGTFHVDHGVSVGAAILGEVIQENTARAKRQKMEQDREEAGVDENELKIQQVIQEAGADRPASKIALRENDGDVSRAIKQLKPTQD